MMAVQRNVVVVARETLGEESEIDSNRKREREKRKGGWLLRARAPTA